MIESQGMEIKRINSTLSEPRPDPRAGWHGRRFRALITASSRLDVVAYTVGLFGPSNRIAIMAFVPMLNVCSVIGSLESSRFRATVNSGHQ
jgi:hypothetical protein